MEEELFQSEEPISIDDAQGQVEIDYFWEKLSSVPEAEQCGWCKDKYGVSWQIMPKNVEELLRRPGAFGRMMDMKKLVIDEY